MVPSPGIQVALIPTPLKVDAVTVPFPREGSEAQRSRRPIVGKWLT